MSTHSSQTLASAAPFPFVIVVGVDFDLASQRALTQALRLAQGQPASTVHACHVVQQVEKAIEAEAVLSHDTLLDQRVEQLQAFVQQAISTMPQGARAPIMLHIGMGEVAGELIQLAVDVQADALVIGSHGNKGLKDMVFGSTTTTLLQQAPCSLLLASVPHYEGLEPSPRIEPPAPEGHEPQRAEPHAYHYRRSLPFAYHDSEVAATGIAPRQVY